MSGWYVQDTTRVFIVFMYYCIPWTCSNCNVLVACKKRKNILIMYRCTMVFRKLHMIKARWLHNTHFKCWISWWEGAQHGNRKQPPQATFGFIDWSRHSGQHQNLSAGKSSWNLHAQGDLTGNVERHLRAMLFDICLHLDWPSWPLFQFWEFEKGVPFFLENIMFIKRDLALQ